MEHRRSDGSWRRFGYDAHGRQVVVWDSAGLVTCQLHDRGGRLTLSVGPEQFELGPLGMPSGELRFSCGQEHGYDACGRQTSRRTLADVAKDFGYTGNWSFRLSEAESAAAHYKTAQLEQCLRVLRKLDIDLKSSKLGSDLLLQKALCELALTRSMPC